MPIHKIHNRARNSDELRILVVSQAPNQWQCPLFRYLAKEDGLKLEVAFQAPTTSFDPEINNIPLWGEHGSRDGFLSLDLPRNYASLVWWAITNVRRRDLDLIILPGWGIKLARVLILASITSRRVRKKTVIFTDSTDLTTRNRRRSISRSVILWGLSRVGFRFAATGNAARKHLVKNGVDNRSIFDMPYVVDNDRIASETNMWRLQRDELRFHTAAVSHRDAPIFLAVTKLVQREAPEHLVQSFILASKDFPSARLLLVGDGSERQRIEDICRQPGGERVIMLGYQPYADLPRFYAAADWFVHLPDLEPWGISVNEAVASALPLLCSTRVGATEDLLENRVNGFLVGAGETAAEIGFREALSTIPSKVEEMGAASFKMSDCVHFRRWSDTLRKLAS